MMEDVKHETPADTTEEVKPETQPEEKQEVEKDEGGVDNCDACDPVAP